MLTLVQNALCVVATLHAAFAPEATAFPSAETMRSRLDAARARIASQTAQYHDPVGPRTWIDGTRLWYCETARDGARRWWLVDARKEGKTPLFNHDDAASVTRSASDRLPVKTIAVEGDMVVVSFESLSEPLLFDLATGRRVAFSTEDNAKVKNALKALELRLKPGSARSRGQGASSGVRFVNRLDESVELFWVDTRGAERSYGKIAAGAEREQHTFGGHAWIVKTAGGEVLGHVVAADVEKTAVIERAATDRGSSPRDPEAVDQIDGQHETQHETHGTSSRDGSTRSRLPVEVVPEGPNLIIRAEGLELFRTTDGSARDGFFGGHWISDAGDAVFAMRVQRADARRVTIVEASPKDQLQPKVRAFDYVKPGDAIDTVIPCLFRLERDAAGALSAREVPLDRTLYATPWSIDRVRMLPGGREVAFLYNQRGHQVVRLVTVDLLTGTARTIAEQSYPTFVDYTNKVWMHWLDATGELLWMTERSGWNHIELIDVATGSVKRRVTEGAWNVRRVAHVDESARTIDIALMGRDAAQDPYHIHHARVSLDAGEVVMQTAGNGTCRVDFSPDRSALVCVRARVDAPPIYELRRAQDGALVVELGRADDSAARAAGWIAPEPFVAKGRDGVTDIWGVVYRPTGYDPSRKYPVIENIYAGPHGQHVPKWFELGGRSREYAELGAIVVQIDGMGTNWRGKAFHDVCWKNLKDAGFPDRIAWMRALAARDAAIDLSRVGIFGGSAGGQNAMRAVLDHADFYDVAVADCGCHDNRMDKIWWNEQWMGWPVDESYAKSSNMEDAAKLGGKLMLVVGGLDENVDPASTMQVAQKLIDAGKDFELLVIPDAGHGAAESEYGNSRRARFLFDALRE
ncbi:MAG: prolyl oligopeptidase family serine peptidase [Limnohabitans sp.]|nr:prolyl oligopeptidase family serine peptidase [Limnohabitans sp.]